MYLSFPNWSILDQTHSRPVLDVSNLFQNRRAAFSYTAANYKFINVNSTPKLKPRENEGTERDTPSPRFEIGQFH